VTQQRPMGTRRERRDFIRQARGLNKILRLREKSLDGKRKVFKTFCDTTAQKVLGGGIITPATTHTIFNYAPLTSSILLIIPVEIWNRACTVSLESRRQSRLRSEDVKSKQGDGRRKCRINWPAKQLGWVSMRLRGDLEGMIISELIHVKFFEDIERVMHRE